MYAIKYICHRPNPFGIEGPKTKTKFINSVLSSDIGWALSRLHQQYLNPNTSFSLSVSPYSVALAVDEQIGSGNASRYSA